MSTLIDTDVLYPQEKRSRIEAKCEMLKQIKTARGSGCCQSGLYMLHNEDGTWKCSMCNKTWEFINKKAYCIS